MISKHGGILLCPGFLCNIDWLWINKLEGSNFDGGQDASGGANLS